MGKYSSDSDDSRRKSHSRRRRRSRSSSSSLDRHRHSSSRSKHSSSSRRDRDRYKSSSSSRYYHRDRRSHSKSRSKRRSRSRDRHHKSHKSSHTHKSSRRSSSSSSSSSSSPSKTKTPPKIFIQKESADSLREKLLQSIKAAESADKKLKEQGIIPKNVRSRNELPELPVKPDFDAVKEIEDDTFVPKSFKSSKNKRGDEKSETVLAEVKANNVKSAMHSSLFDDPQAKLDKWVKKLYLIRQKALIGD